MFSQERGPGWVSLNKEGIYSLPGYLAIALLGAGVGHSVAIRYAPPCDVVEYAKCFFV